MKEETAKAILESNAIGYEKIAEEFSQSRTYFWKELEFVKDYIKENSSILDVGCGNGRFFEIIKDKKISYTGIDTSSKFISIAKEKYPSTSSGQAQVKFFRANAVELPFGNDSFDVAVSFAVLHHIPSKKLREEFLSEIHRVLKKDGVLILSVWNLWQKRYLPAIAKYAFFKLIGVSKIDFKDIFLSFGKEKDIRYLHAFTKKGLERMISQRNFAIEKSLAIKRKSGQSNFLIVCHRI